MIWSRHKAAVGFGVGIAAHLVFRCPTLARPIEPTAPTKHLVLREDEV
jgi:hypothetical protein